MEIEQIHDITILNQLVKYLSTLAECPDIDIKSYPNEFGGVRLRAELTLPNGEIISSEETINDNFANDDIVNAIKDHLLKEVGGLFLANAYKKRSLNEVNISVGKYYYSYKKIKENLANIELQKENEELKKEVQLYRKRIYRGDE